MSRINISILERWSLILNHMPKNHFCTIKSSQDLENRRREVMGRGLPKKKPIEGVKQILIVASGKGGVGKSTTSVNLAVALKMNEPAKAVGLLDADVFGPTVPLMMNLDDSPIINEKNLMEPLVNYDIKCMSMGFLVNKKSPVIWRGLMVMSALDKLIRQVAWGPLDYLIVDTPPGTGDTHLSLVQNVPVAGVLLVTTPQKAALDVTRRGALMYQKLNVPLVGIVENMSSVICPKCNHEASLFKDGSLSLAWELGINILCKIPFNDDIAEGCDNGKPILISKPNSKQAEAYKKLGKNVAEFLQEQLLNTT
ncbi:iron-sulfur protein NUBPL [Leptopilina boulardi]|uniref:iron-sulfur protein NUBPL n=1 Tax=Leptopilina boulardi TaxID=63433 RepID=UPI0021F5D2EF|nr:iron-sulfur protein NUBPL [Leptopilina boulardi]